VWGWEPFGRPKGCAPDRSEAYAEPQSQRLELTGAEAGIAQGSLTFEKGVAYAVRVVAKAEGHVRSLRVALADGRDVQTEKRFPLEDSDWQTHACTLTANRGTAQGRLVIAAKGPGRFWLGAASLMRADHVGGFRRDVLETTALAQPPTFRWPGGNMASGYHWRDGVGPQDQRPTRWDRAWNAWVYNDMGTDEFIAYCRRLGAEPCICVNAGEGTAAEAAAWVQYCNGAADTPMGRLRAATGHPEPYGVKYWDIGNEIWGSWQLGHTTAEDYGLRAVEFARAMRGADPDIVLVASGVLDDGFDRWNRRMLSICGQAVDMLSVHDYTAYDARKCTDAEWAKVVGAPLRIERSLRNTLRIAEQAAGKRLPLTFDEWNTTPRHAHVPHGLPDALYAAGVLHAMQRLGDDVPIGNLALLSNVLGALRTTPTEVIETPVFLAFRLLADHSGSHGVAVAAEAPAFRKVPALDVAASLSEDKATLHVTAVNRHPRRPARVNWQLGPFEPEGDVRITVLAGPEPWARNTPDGPHTVSVTTHALPWPEARRRVLPAASLVGFSVPIR
ncbi:MAG: alpha-L-arabinofuranosidase C-terminal domain-containing protein, partial [Planctomycetota bacterium]